MCAVILRGMRRHPIEERYADDFRRLRALSIAYWTRKEQHEDAAEQMRNEAVRLTRKGWEEGRPRQTARVAEAARMTRQYIARLAGDGWDRSLNGTGVADAPEDFGTLDRLAAAVFNYSARCDRLEKAMRAEAIRLAQQGKALGRYGQTAAVARVTGWSREHVDRLAGPVKRVSDAGRAGGRGLPASKSAA